MQRWATQQRIGDRCAIDVSTTATMTRLCGYLRYAPEAAQLCRAIVSTPASNRLVCLAPLNRTFIDSSGSRFHHTIPTAVALFCSPPSTHHRGLRGHRIDHHHLCCGSDDDGRVCHLIDLFHKGYKTTIKPFVFLTEPSGVGCKGLIVRFTKNAVQSYIFHQKISKNKRSCY